MISTAIKYIRFFGGKYNCIACGRNVRTFFRFSDELVNRARENGFPYEFTRMETLNLDLCNCPFCLTNDRERLYLIYLESFIFKNYQSLSKLKILDFAPNEQFSSYIKQKGVSYISADLFRTDVDLKIDICDMQELPDNAFNFIICSHILEHVPTPKQALKELYRILRPGGEAIIMVPLFWDVKETKEDKNHTTEKERWKHYGQFDHVRLFSKKDFISIIETTGFVLKTFTSKDFDRRLIQNNAIAENSVLYIASK